MTRLRLALVVALAASGCLVPSLEELEKDRARTCDDAHPCLDGYACLAGTCRKVGSLDCTPGDTRACGPSEGECEPGTERCGDEGTWEACTGAIGPATEVCDGKDNDCDGTADEEAVTSSCGVDAGVCAGRARACLGGMPEAVCTAASFGAGYEPAEASCDGKDNDCDGAVDEALPAQACALTQGVCAGATTTCTGGSYPACTAATYAAHASAYEATETSCDGEDNDCDGFTDSWPAQQVSDGGTLVQRAPAVVAIPNTGTAARRDVLVLYEAGPRVAARTLTAAGALTVPRAPSASVAAAQRAWAPALASLGAQMAEAWFEELPGPVFRLALALAGPSGEALVNGSPGIFPLAMTGPGQKVAVGLSSTRLVVAWAQHDTSSTSSATTVSVASCPRQLDALCAIEVLGAGRSPALLVDGDRAIVVYESGGRLRLVRLDVPSTGGVTAGPATTFGGSNERDVALTGSVSALALYTVLPGSPETLWRREGSCATACDPTAFTVTPSWVTLGGSASGLAFAADGATQVLAWTELRAGASVVRAIDPAATTPAPFEVAAAGRRPAPVVPGNAGFLVFYDTEAATTGAPDVVLQRRFCPP